MFTNVNLSAPIGPMAFLGAGFFVLVAAVVFVYALVTRRLVLARGVPKVAVILAATYLGIMLIFSFKSSEQVLARGQEKHFCEIDCHLAYSILDVRQTKTLGSPPNQTTASGNFYMVTVKTRFDENTIGPTRGNGQLFPNSRVVTILDDQGRSFSASSEGERALALTGGTGNALTTPLRPSETYVTNLVFDLPADVRNPALLLREGEWPTYFVIGHENSPLHKKTRFQLGV